MEPLTIEQLESLGFAIEYKKKNGQKVFKSCYLDAAISSWPQADIVGSFYSPPSFLDIIDRVTENATAREKQRITEKFAEKMFD